MCFLHVRERLMCSKLPDAKLSSQGMTVKTQVGTVTLHRLSCCCFFHLPSQLSFTSRGALQNPKERHSQYFKTLDLIGASAPKESLEAG